MTLTIVLAAAAVIAGLDQLIKYFILQTVAESGPVKVLGDLLSFVYVENRGVAFGMLQDHVWLFAVITFVLIGIFIWLIISKKMTGKLFLVSAMLMIGGGLGNLIDRLFRGFVVDYISLSFFPPVCNFADYCITAGAIMFIAALLFHGDRTGKKTVPAVNTENGADAAAQAAEGGDDDKAKQEEPDGEENAD